MSQSRAKQFLTDYWQGGALFGSHLWAQDAADAVEVAKRRAIGETVIGEPDTYSRPPKPGSSGFAHWLMFVAWVALRSGESVDILADDGIVHEMLHEHRGIEELKRVHDDYNALLQRIGFLPK